MASGTDDLEQLFADIGLKVGRSTETEVWGWCPGHYERLGHHDRKPSNWSVNRTTGIHNCFSCGYAGDLMHLVMDVTGMGIWDAARFIRNRQLSLEPVLELGQQDDEPTREIITEQSLWVFDDPPKREIRRRNLTREACNHYGVLWDRRHQAWILPIRDADGTLLGYQEKGRDRFLNHPRSVRKRTTLFGIERFPEDATAILVESPLDVVRLYAEGYEGGLASFGSVVANEQMRLIREVASELIVALDNDPAGLATSKRLAGLAPDTRFKKQKLHGDWYERIPMWFFDYGSSRAKDPGDMTADEIHAGIAQAVHVLRWRAA